VALLPHTALLTIAGIGAAVGWVARRRATWNVRQATTIFGAGAVAIAVVAGGVQTLATAGHWHDARTFDDQLVAALADAPQTDVVMSADPGAIWYLSGHPGVVTPADSLPTVEQAMRSYNVRWLVLESDNIMPALEPVLAGQVQPAWLSRPVAVIGTRASNAQAPNAGAPRGAVYAVCLAPGDSRCTS